MGTAFRWINKITVFTPKKSQDRLELLCEARANMGLLNELLTRLERVCADDPRYGQIMAISRPD